MLHRPVPRSATGRIASPSPSEPFARQEARTQLVSPSPDLRQPKTPTSPIPARGTARAHLRLLAQRQRSLSPAPIRLLAASARASRPKFLLPQDAAASADGKSAPANDDLRASRTTIASRSLPSAMRKRRRRRWSRPLVVLCDSGATTLRRCRSCLECSSEGVGGSVRPLTPRSPSAVRAPRLAGACYVDDEPAPAPPTGALLRSLDDAGAQHVAQRQPRPRWRVSEQTRRIERVCRLDSPEFRPAHSAQPLLQVDVDRLNPSRRPLLCATLRRAPRGLGWERL